MLKAALLKIQHDSVSWESGAVLMEGNERKHTQHLLFSLIYSPIGSI